MIYEVEENSFEVINWLVYETVKTKKGKVDRKEEEEGEENEENEALGVLERMRGGEGMREGETSPNNLARRI